MEFEPAPPPPERVLPRAIVTPRRRTSASWVLPVLALAGAALLAWDAWRSRGPTLTLRFEDGRGVRAGDRLRYRGIAVGEVRAVELAPDLAQVALTLRLDPRAEALARAGSRFWIVRPHVSLEGVEGLETLFGARYLAVLPGPADGERRTDFVGLEEPPVLAELDPDGLEIVLEARSRHGLAPGAPLVYRRIQIGSVLSVGLASDATTVEARVYVRPEYAALVRADSRFWEVGGVELGLGLVHGLRVEVDSLRALLVGGIALATPTRPGPRVTTGHRFELADEPKDEWTKWRPGIPIGSALVGDGGPLPAPLRARTSWRSGRWFGGRVERSGWILRLREGTAGPVDVLRPAVGAKAEDLVLEVEGESLPLPAESRWQAHGVCVVELDLLHATGAEIWPDARRAALGAPTDCLLVGDAAAAPFPLAAGRLATSGAGWTVDGSVPLDERWHGAAVLERESGELVGLLLVEDGAARVAPLPAP